MTPLHLIWNCMVEMLCVLSMQSPVATSPSTIRARSATVFRRHMFAATTELMRMRSRRRISYLN